MTNLTAEQVALTTAYADRLRKIADTVEAAVAEGGDITKIPALTDEARKASGQTFDATRHAVREANAAKRASEHAAKIAAEWAATEPGEEPTPTEDTEGEYDPTADPAHAYKGFAVDLG